MHAVFLGVCCSHHADRLARRSWSLAQTGDKHGAAHVHVGCTVGICGRTQGLQAWARMLLRRDWLRMGPRSYRHRQRCHHRRAPRQDGHHHRRRRRPAWRQALVSWQVGRPVAWPIAADTTSPPHSRHRSLLMVLLWCAAAKWRCGRVRLPNGAARWAAAEWRCGACGCRMSLRACDMWKRLCRAVFLCVMCSFSRIDSVSFVLSDRHLSADEYSFTTASTSRSTRTRAKNA